MHGYGTRMNRIALSNSSHWREVAWEINVRGLLAGGKGGGRPVECEYGHSLPAVRVTFP